MHGRQGCGEELRAASPTPAVAHTQSSSSLFGACHAVSLFFFFSFGFVNDLQKYYDDDDGDDDVADADVIAHAQLVGLRLGLPYQNELVQLSSLSWSV